jgi:hypothetical protein
MVTGIDNERETARLVAVRGQTTRPRVRRRSPVVCRCRPGEVATWVRLDLTAGQADELRDAASRAGVSVDAWLAVMVEFTTALPILDDAVGPADCARNRLALVLKSPVMVAALPGWRTWQVYLARHTASGPDELPEVVLPERLLARCNGDVQFESALAAASDWPLARSCELAACGRGRSLEAFMLQAALA